MKLIALILLTFALPVLASDPDAARACSFEDVFEQLACEKSYHEGRFQVEQAAAKRAALARETGDAPRANSSFPELARLYGQANNLTTVWVHAGAEFEARVGDPIAGEWKLAEILSNGVKLTSSRGSVRTVLIAGYSHPPSDLSVLPTSPTAAARFVPGDNMPADR